MPGDQARQVTIPRVEEPPTIDGDLSDFVWEAAAVITDFAQVFPTEGAEPSQATEVRILYTADAICVGFRCFDDESDRIIAKQMLRDVALGSDDHVSFIIDPYFDRRNGFFFETNPLGVRGDALIENNRNFIRDWDGIWYAESQIDELGWTAEILIPFKTISFDPDTSAWGFNAERFIRRSNERARWSGISQSKSINSVADAGVLEGIADIRQGVGLDIKPYAKTVIAHGDDVEDFELDLGLDVFYRVTPSLTWAVTFNTDFAETEVDERRVNLTRFPLFFPEKRDFFLQDAGIFQFGGIRRNPLPFQSRRIGLANGEAVPIYAGTKLTGRAGPWNVGVLGVVQEGVDDEDLTPLGVARLSLNVLNESTLGMIATAGDPTSNDENYVGGFDFNYRNSEFYPGKSLEGQAFILGSSSPQTVGEDYSWGARLSYPNDRVSWFAGLTRIGNDYDAALGFVPRAGIHEAFVRWQYRWRVDHDLIRSVEIGVNPEIITNLDNDVESEEFEFTLLELETNDGDEFQLEFSANREVLDRNFRIRPGIVIDRGDYRFNRIGARLETSSGRPIAFNARIGGGQFYNGERLDTTFGVSLRPSKYLFVGLEWEQNDVNLPDGDFVVQIARARLNLQFTPDLSWTNFIQWDNTSESLGVNSRVQWIIKPGNELFFVVNQAFDTFDDRFATRSTEVTTKLGWTFRF